MQFKKIKKRTGLLVDFQPSKVTTAIEKAMLAIRGEEYLDKVQEVTEHVLNQMALFYGHSTPDVEGVQDLVEKSLIEKGFFDVARAYILYRERQRFAREEKKQEIAEKLEENTLQIMKRDGRVESFCEDKLSAFFHKAVAGCDKVVNIQHLVEKTKEGIYERIPSFEISTLAVMTARAFIEQDPAYNTVTTRLFLSSIYKEVLVEKFNADTFENQYRKSFVTNLQEGVESGRFTPQLLEFDLAFLAQKIDPQRDNEFNFRGLQSLYDRYLLKNKQGSCVETPQALWMRVSMGLSLFEKNREEKTIEFYNLLSSMRFVSSTPTLFHSGTTHPQLSSCYITKVDDSLEHIFKSIGDNAQLSKWSGGLGNDWTSVRGMGAYIKSTGVESQGVIPFLKIANDTTAAINRSGKRRGATCAYLENWHIDIEDFLDLRRNTGDERRRTHDMNTAVWVSDLFMKRVLEDGNWTLFSPNETPELHELYGQKFETKYHEYEILAQEGKLQLSKQMKAVDLWRKMITRLFETGHPWITFKDPCNVRSPQDHQGVIHSSNLCTEITLNTSAEETAVCNLGSINLPRHIRNGKLDEALIEQTVNTAMRMLDNVVDINFYPTQEARHANLKHRPVGLGIMGFHDALYLQNFRFNSEDAMTFADESMEMISYYACWASSRLAQEKGAYASYTGSKWDRGLLPCDTIDLLEKERQFPIELQRGGIKDWTPVRESIRKHGMRNSNCLAIAPTATISNISGCFPSIEPIYKNLYVKSNMSGEFTVANKYLIEDLKQLGLWTPSILSELKQNDGNLQNMNSIPSILREKYKTAFEIDPKWLIMAAARRGKWIDQSQSLNLFLPSTSGKEIADTYIYAWKMGLKTTYYLRTMGASGIEKSTVSKMQNTSTQPPANMSCDPNDLTCEACQ